MKLKSLKTLLMVCSLLIVSVANMQAAEMQYISREDLKKSLSTDQNAYLILDVRKAADYEKGHIASAASADLDPAMGLTGNDATGIATLKKVLTEQVGNAKGTGKKMVILCYSGARYAQKATDLLTQIGADTSTVYTLQGGYKAWTAEDAGPDYKKLMISGDKAGSPTK